LPSALACLPSAFEELMDVTLSGLTYELCLLYLDDIIDRLWSYVVGSSATVSDRVR